MLNKPTNYQVHIAIAIYLFLTLGHLFAEDGVTIDGVDFEYSYSPLTVKASSNIVNFLSDAQVVTYSVRDLPRTRIGFGELLIDGKTYRMGLDSLYAVDRTRGRVTRWQGELSIRISSYVKNIKRIDAGGLARFIDNYKPDITESLNKIERVSSEDE